MRFYGSGVDADAFGYIGYLAGSIFILKFFPFSYFEVAVKSSQKICDYVMAAEAHL